MRHGYEVGFEATTEPSEGDVLLIWNRNSYSEVHCRAFEKVGAHIFVAENGYIGSDKHGHQLYALALDHHSGAGRWHVGDYSRWEALGIDLLPWKKDGSEIVIMPQRSIGCHEHNIAMPFDWQQQVYGLLRSRSNRPIRVRQHPGASRESPLADLKNAWAGVVWGSGAGIKCIVGGIPVFHYLEKWIGCDSAIYNPKSFEEPYKGTRTTTLTKVAWAQWTTDEIQQGIAIECLLALPSTAS
jgi:hypothetical protein